MGVLCWAARPAARRLDVGIGKVKYGDLVAYPSLCPYGKYWRLTLVVPRGQVGPVFGGPSRLDQCSCWLLSGRDIHKALN